MVKNPVISRLLDLQEMDQEIGELQSQLNQYPTIWEEVKSGLREKSKKLETLRAEETARHEERKKIEQDLRLCSERLKQYQSQSMLVKTSKEMQANQAQIDSLKKTIQRLEERGVELLDSEPEFRERLEAAGKQLAADKAEAREERERIRGQVAEKKSRIEATQKERDSLAEKIDDASLQDYERVRARWPENPVVPVRNGSCSGCNFAMLPNKLISVHKNDEIVHCDNCGRILSHDETFEEDQESESA